MRLVDLPRTSSFRLALRFLVLFGVASFVLFGFLYIETKHYVVGRIDGWLGREQAIFRAMDRDDLLQRVNAHAVADPTLDRPMTLFDPAGNRLAGNPLNLPPAVLASMPQDEPFEFKMRQGRQVSVFRGIAHHRPSGDLLVVALNMEGPQAFADVLVRAFIWGGLVTAALGLAGAAYIGADAVRRIDGVTRAIRRIVSGNLSERLPTRGVTDDLDRLVHVINGMLGELERLMHEVKGVCDNIAHDLRTPLTRLLAGLERTRRRAGSAEEYATAVDEAVFETKDVLRTFGAILRISEVESGARRAGFTDADLSAVVADAVEFYEPMAEEKGIKLRGLPQEGLPAVIRGDPSLLFEAVANLVDNALKFTPPGGRVTVRGFAADGAVGVEVADTGPGIAPAESGAVLGRFYRGEASRNTRGSGLGLALVAAVARLHGMDMAISDTKPGCRVTIVSRAAEYIPVGTPPTAIGHSDEGVASFAASKPLAQGQAAAD